ncbi:MAG TPA: hypothetical protein VGJ84_12245 [Polyangiaceae bacterium]
MTRLAAAIAGSGVFLTAFAASACPACAGRDVGSVTYLVLLGAMILLPFAVAWVAFVVLRKRQAVR